MYPRNQRSKCRHRKNKLAMVPNTKICKICKSPQTLKNTKYIYFFQNFKHIKKQQHQINILAHKYGESHDI